MSEKVILVTGGGTGIGRATAHAYAGLGATVIVTGRSSTSLDDAGSGWRTIHPVVADLTVLSDIDRLRGEIADRWGRLDVLVNNAGVPGAGALADLTAEQVAPVVATNVLAPLHVTHAVLPLLTAAQGTVVNVSTAVGRRAWPGSSLYAATKAALESLTRSWAVELAAHGIRVVGVAPGAINTTIGERNGMTAAQAESLRDWQIRHTPMGRLGEPEEVADAIVALTSAAGRFVTGAILAVDGGAVVA